MASKNFRNLFFNSIKQKSESNTHRKSIFKKTQNIFFNLPLLIVEKLIHLKLEIQKKMLKI